MRIGGLTIAPALVLAPMSGVTDMAFRRLVRECSPGAVGLVVSEFISIEGLTRQDLKSHRMMRFDPSERPISIQIFGSDLDRMAEAAAIVQSTGVDVVDINCGCPVPKVVKRGGGAELMRREAHLERMLRAVRRELSVPLTLKMRTGWDVDSINCVAIAQMAEAAGAAMVTVHGRTRVQLYTGSSDWEQIAAVKRAVGIPVLGSGDVIDVESARSRFGPSGVDGLAIGRGAMSNPWVFAQIAADLEGRSHPDPSVPDRLRALRRYAQLLDEIYPPRVTAARLRGMVCRMSRGFPGSVALRDAAAHTRTREELLEVLDRFESGALEAQAAQAAALGTANAEGSARSPSGADDALASAG